MVIVEPSTDQEKYEQEVYGWIKWWNWVREDAVLKGAPVEPHTRFGEKLWSSGQQ